MANRAAVKEKLDDSPKFSEEIMEGAISNNITWSEQLQNEVNEDGVSGRKDESWNHPIVYKDFLRRDGILLRSEGRKGSSPLDKFTKRWHQAALLDDTEEKWQNSFGNHQTRKRFQFASAEDQHQANQIAVAEGRLPDITPELRFELEQAGTITGFTPGAIYRPYQEGDQIETPRFEPDVDYTDLGPVQILSVPDWRIATFNVNNESLLMNNIPEGTPSPTIQLDLGQATATAHRHALGVEIGNTQMLSGVPAVVEGLQRMVEEIGTRQADAFATRTGKLIFDVGTGVASGSAVDATIEQILLASTAFTNGFIGNRVIGAREPIIKLIATQAAFANTQVQNRAVGTVLAGGTRLGNRSGNTEVAYFFRDTANAGLTGDKLQTLFFFDFNRTVNILDYPGGELDARDFNASTAMHTRYFARWQGHYLKQNRQVRTTRFN